MNNISTIKNTLIAGAMSVLCLQASAEEKKPLDMVSADTKKQVHQAISLPATHITPELAEEKVSRQDMASEFPPNIIHADSLPPSRISRKELFAQPIASPVQ